MKVKELLSEHGIALDIGCANTDELSDQRKSAAAKVEDEKDDMIHAINRNSSGRPQRIGKCFFVNSLAISPMTFSASFANAVVKKIII